MPQRPLLPFLLFFSLIHTMDEILKYLYPPSTEATQQEQELQQQPQQQELQLRSQQQQTNATIDNMWTNIAAGGGTTARHQYQHHHHRHQFSPSELLVETDFGNEVSLKGIYPPSIEATKQQQELQEQELQEQLLLQQQELQIQLQLQQQQTNATFDGAWTNTVAGGGTTDHHHYHHHDYQHHQFAPSELLDETGFGNEGMLPPLPPPRPPPTPPLDYFHPPDDLHFLEMAMGKRREIDGIWTNTVSGGGTTSLYQDHQPYQDHHQYQYHQLPPELLVNTGYCYEFGVEDAVHFHSPLLPPPMPLPMTPHLSSKDLHSLENDNEKRKAIEEELKHEIDKDAKVRQIRMAKNRESAARSRARKNAYVNELQRVVKQMDIENKSLFEEEAERIKNRRKQLNECIIPVTEHPKPKEKLRRLNSL